MTTMRPEKERLTIPDTGWRAPGYCPACLDHWRSPVPIRPLHDACREALRAIAKGERDEAA
jgi:hypothetical protein